MISDRSHPLSRNRQAAALQQTSRTTQNHQDKRASMNTEVCIDRWALRRKRIFIEHMLFGQ